MEQNLTLEQLTRKLGVTLTQRHLRLATAESCTGGWIAQQVTSLAGSSDWFDAGIVSYSNHAKTHLLGVDANFIETYGAVSENVVKAMAVGVLQRTRANVSVAVSGIAGPSGGSPDKPVGTVWLAWAMGQFLEAAVFHFPGDREQVRYRSLCQAIIGLNNFLAEHP